MKLHHFKHQACCLGQKLSWLPPLLLRLAIGYVFVSAGWGKLHNLEKVTEFFASIGIPMAKLQAPFVAVVEFVGGICLILGLCTRFVSIPLAFTMVVALATAHRDSFESLDKLTETPPFLYLLMLLALVQLGSGCLSLDKVLCRKLHTHNCETKDETQPNA